MLLLSTLRIRQDRVLADRIQSDGRACVVVCNKWDLVEDKNDASYNKVGGAFLVAVGPSLVACKRRRYPGFAFANLET